jgi:23S rRNA G2445 N2-methylase RlmL
MKADREYLVTTAPGLEGLLVEELAGLGVAARATSAGPVAVPGGWETAARIVVHSRIASRLLLPLRRFAAAHRAMLYDQVRRLPWPEILPRGATLAVHAVGNPAGTDFTLAYAALRVKDAVCDTFRAHGLPRPDVDRHRPDARVVAFFNAGRGALSLDLVGEPLHRRGYREEGARAPLRENRAAALLAFAEVDGTRPVVDPFCGSGTLVVEAAMRTARRAPGLLRPLSLVAAVRLFPQCRPFFEAERERAAAAARPAAPAPVTGIDRDKEALRAARRNAERAGVEGLVRWEEGDALSLTAPASFLVTNPPYGERLETPGEAAALLREFVHRAKHHAVGSRLAMVLPRGPLEKAVGLRPDRKLAVESGEMGLRFLRFDLYAGSRGKGA